MLGDTLDRPSWNRLERIFRTHDYLPIPSGYPTDLTIDHDPKEKRFSLGNSHQTVLTVPEQELFDSPDKVISAYSQNQDRNRMFRKLTMVCLLVGFPLVLFTLLFSVLGSLSNLFLTVALSNVIAAILCIVVGGLLWVPVYQGYTATVTPADPAIALSASSAVTRIAALRQACENHWDIAVDAKRQGLEKSPHIAERYWLAQSLAYAKDPYSHAMLLTLVGDPVPIVACQALWAMGERKNWAVVPEIIERINTSSHWYIQMYGYRALRNMGWVQLRSPQLSY